MVQVALRSEELSSCVELFRPNRPVLVTTRDRDGTVHVAPFAWCVPTSAEPPMVTLALLTRPRKQHTLVNIEREGEFVVNLPRADLAAAIVQSSYRFPAGVRKAALLGLKYRPAQQVRVPVIEQCRAQVECRLVTRLATGDHTLLVAKVLAASCTPGQERDNGAPDLTDLAPCLHLGHRSLADCQEHYFLAGGRIWPVAVPYHPGGAELLSKDHTGQKISTTISEPFTGITAEIHVMGFCHPVGPCCMDSRGDLLVADWATGWIYRVSTAGMVTEYADTGGMPTDMCLGREGVLYVCDAGRREVLSITRSGTIKALASGYQGRQFLGPNGCTLDGQGNLYFTDADGFRPCEPLGSVYRLGVDQSLEVLATHLLFPTGLAVSAKGDRLYVAETLANAVHCIVLDKEGRALEHRLFARLRGGTGPVGLALDCAGNLYVAQFGKGTIAVLAPTGQLLAELPTTGALPAGMTICHGWLIVTEVENGSVTRLKGVNRVTGCW